LQLVSGLFKTAGLPDSSAKHWNIGGREHVYERIGSLNALQQVGNRKAWNNNCLELTERVVEIARMLQALVGKGKGETVERWGKR
jgi:hypothetical protein